MKTLFFVVIVAVSHATLGAIATAQPVTQMVPAAVPWTDTGIDIVAGETLIINTDPTARVVFGSGRTITADGIGDEGVSPRNGTVILHCCVIMPDAVITSLVGKIGGTTAVGSGTPVPEGRHGKGPGFVGSSYQQVIPTSGRLFVGFNDDIFCDNSGAFSVDISVIPNCAPLPPLLRHTAATSTVIAGSRVTFSVDPTTLEWPNAIGWLAISLAPSQQSTPFGVLGIDLGNVVWSSGPDDPFAGWSFAIPYSFPTLDIYSQALILKCPTTYAWSESPGQPALHLRVSNEPLFTQDTNGQAWAPASEFVGFLVGSGEPPISIQLPESFDPLFAYAAQVSPGPYSGAVAQLLPATGNIVAFQPDLSLNGREIGRSTEANEPIRYSISVLDSQMGQSPVFEIVQDDRTILLQEHLDAITWSGLPGPVPSETDIRDKSGVSATGHPESFPPTMFDVQATGGGVYGHYVDRGSSALAIRIYNELGLTPSVGRLKINSYYRNPRYNTARGGSARSRHPQGLAIDINIRELPGSVRPVDVYRAAFSRSYGGVTPGPQSSKEVILESGSTVLLRKNWIVPVLNVIPPFLNPGVMVDGLNNRWEDSDGDGVPDLLVPGLPAGTQVSVVGERYLVDDSGSNLQTDAEMRVYLHEVFNPSSPDAATHVHAADSYPR